MSDQRMTSRARHPLPSNHRRIGMTTTARKRAAATAALLLIPTIAAAVCFTTTSWTEPFTRPGHDTPVTWRAIVPCDTGEPFVPGVLSSARVTWELGEP